MFGTVASLFMGRSFFLRSVVLADAATLLFSIVFATYRVFDVLAPWLATT